MPKKPKPCKWEDLGCNCNSIKDEYCEKCLLYKPIDSGYGYCKALPEPIVVAWCKDPCSLLKKE